MLSDPTFEVKICPDQDIFNSLPVIMTVIVQYRQMDSTEREKAITLLTYMNSSVLVRFKRIRDYQYCIVFPCVSFQAPFRQKIL